MAKAKTKVAEKKVAKKKTRKNTPKEEEIDTEAKAEAFDKIVEKNKAVHKLYSRYLKAKDSSLEAKKVYDVANAELHELIEQCSTAMPLFEGKPEDHKKNDDETEEPPI